MTDALDAAIDALYAGERAAFTPARDALAKELRTRKDRDAATRVKALRKPTIAAWAVNLAVRHEPVLVDALFAAGAQLRAAQAALMHGASADLRDANAARRAAAHALLAVVVRDAGVPVTVAWADEVVRFLEAAAVDPALGAELRAARLERVDRAGTGFDQLAALAPDTLPERPALRLVPAPAPEPELGPQSDPAAELARRAAAEAERELERERARQRERERRRAELTGELALAAAAVEACREALDAAEARVVTVRRQLDELDPDGG